MQHQHHHQFSFQQPHNSISRLGVSVHPSVHESLPLAMAGVQNYNQSLTSADLSKGERGKSSGNDEDEPRFAEDPSDAHIDSNGGKQGMFRFRVKWNGNMVRLLITALSYMCEDAKLGKGLPRKKNLNLQRRRKWKSISKVMAERGHYVSPQQCEDKFNDLNKKYKRLNEILGKGISCQVVEKPELLDVLNNIAENAKVEVRRILSSKQLFYEEMCSYHNGNRLHLPHDLELQHSMRSALRSKEGQGNNKGRRRPRDYKKDDKDEEHDELEDNYALNGDQRSLNGVHTGSAKRSKPCQGHGGVPLEIPAYPLNHNRTSSSVPPNAQGGDLNQVLLDIEKRNLLEKRRMQERLVQIEQAKFQIQAKRFALENKKLKWQSSCRKKDRELERYRKENERIKLENEQMSIDLKRTFTNAGFR